MITLCNEDKLYIYTADYSVDFNSHYNTEGQS